MINDRTEQIRKEALKLFIKYGYKSTSMQRIATEVGLLKGSLYYHINSKSDLLFNVFAEPTNEMLKSIKEILDQDLPPDIKLKNAIENHIQKEIRYFDEHRLYLQEEKSLPRKLRKDYREQRKQYQEYFEKILIEGVDNGCFRSNIDIKAIKLSLLGMLNSLVEWYKPSGYLTKNKITKAMWDLIMHGLKS